jgi:hypothetical protein
MRKYRFILILIVLFYACGPSKVCGGPGGKRCVQLVKNPMVEKLS